MHSNLKYLFESCYVVIDKIMPQIFLLAEYIYLKKLHPLVMLRVFRECERHRRNRQKCNLLLELLKLPKTSLVIIIVSGIIELKHRFIQSWQRPGYCQNFLEQIKGEWVKEGTRYCRSNS